MRTNISYSLMCNILPDEGKTRQHVLSFLKMTPKLHGFHLPAVIGGIGTLFAAIDIW